MVWGLSAAPAVDAQDARDQWQALNQDMVRAYQEGRYQDSIPLAERAYQLAQQGFGLRDPDTLTSMNILAALYESQSAMARPSRSWRRSWRSVARSSARRIRTPSAA
jgi:Tetratricopeptide repeat